MLKRWLPCLAMVCLAAAPALAADDKPATPTIVVRAQSLEVLLADAKYLAALVDHEEEGKQLEGFIKSLIGDKGLEGIDIKRPLGLYATVAANPIDSTAVGLIPIADEKAIMGLVERLNFKVTKGEDGFYTVSGDPLPVDVYVRFANQYAYVTARDRSAIAKDRLLDPAALLPVDKIGTLSVTVRIDQIPENLKRIGLTQLELGLSREKDREIAGESQATHEFRMKVLDEIYRQAAALIEDGAEASVRLDIDREKNNLALELNLTAKEGSRLAANLADLGKSSSLFSAVPAADSALKVLVHVALPETIRKSLEPVIDEGIARELEKERDPQKRALGEKLLKSLAPTLKAGELDAVLDVRGPGEDKHYTVVAGVKIKEGVQLEKVLRQIADALPPADRAKITFDVERAGTVAIHRIDILKDADADARRLLGEGPVYFAVRDDALLVAAGDQALDALKSALAAQAGPAKPLQFEVSVRQFVELLAREQKAAPQIAGQVFGSDKNADKIRVAVEGGASLKVRVEVQAALVQFLVKLDQEQKKNR